MADVQFYVSVKTNLQISVVDINGKTVLSKNKNEVAEGLHVEQIDLTTLVKGIYFLNFNGTDFNYSRKIVKE